LKKRLDLLLVEQGLAESRTQAQRLIHAGLVRVAGQVADKPGTLVATSAEIALQARPRFVSRGGEKLEAALVRFGLNVGGVVAADVGASSGGFTDCLLQHGARRVYAIDVGYGQFDWRLRNDSRVVVMERTNVRYLESLPEVADLVTVDVSFISLGLILPVVVRWFSPHPDLMATSHPHPDLMATSHPHPDLMATSHPHPDLMATSHPHPTLSLEGRGKRWVVALIKPQFEAGRQEVGRRGVVRDLEVHRRVLKQVAGVAARLGLGLRGLMPSPLRGPAGNIEFLGWWELGAEGLELEAAVATCMTEVEAEG